MQQKELEHTKSRGKSQNFQAESKQSWKFWQGEIAVGIFKTFIKNLGVDGDHQALPITKILLLNGLTLLKQPIHHITHPLSTPLKS